MFLYSIVFHTLRREKRGERPHCVASERQNPTLLLSFVHSSTPPRYIAPYQHSSTPPPLAKAMLRTLPSLFLLASLSPVFAIPLETRDDRLPFDSHPSTPVKRAAELRAFNSPASANLDKRASTVIKQQVKNWVFSSCNSYAGDSFVELGNGGTVEGCIDLCIAAGVQSCGTFLFPSLMLSSPSHDCPNVSNDLYSAAVYAGGSCIGSTKANSDAAPHQDSTSSYCLDPCSGDASEACGSRYGGLIYNVVPGPTRLLNDPYWTCTSRFLPLLSTLTS